MREMKVAPQSRRSLWPLAAPPPTTTTTTTGERIKE